MKKKRLWFFNSLIVVVVLLFACGSNNTSSSESPSSNKKDTVVIGVTNSIETLNPLTGGSKEVDKYAIGFSFLPLVELNNTLEFDGQLAESITTEDNTTFTVHLNDDAKWSDGEDITADDVIFTILKMTNPDMLNTNVFSYANIKGFDENGNSPADANEIEGLVKVDDKTLNIVSETQMDLNSFENTFGRYIFTVPKHILEKISTEELSKYDWFNHPDVISGPYFLKDYDSENHANFALNEAYWNGQPKISNVTLKITDSSQLYTGLKTGEIDFVQQTMGSIAQSDYKNVQDLDNIDSVLDEPITNQMVFLNNDTLSDSNLRHAILLGIDREKIVTDLLDGNAELTDGFLSSFSPYYDSSVNVTAYNPDKAKELVKKSNYDSSKELKFVINSGDKTFAQAADVITAQLKEIGITIQVEAVNLSTLTTKAASHDYDILTVQYTMSPIDPYPDINWLINSEDDWPNYQNEVVNENLQKVQTATSTDEIKDYYWNVTKQVQEDLPFFSGYFIRSLGASNKNLQNATPHTYGSFNNIQDWEFE